MANRPDETTLIETYLAPLAGPGAFSFKDDAALLSVPRGCELVVTTDAVAEGVHFLPDTSPEKLAKKAIRVNLSDLAAKGARPLGISLSLGLADDWDEEWISSFAKGLGADIATYGIELSGGDTFRSPGGTVLSVTAFGCIDTGRYVSRTGARPGDLVYVSGTIGDAYLGLMLAKGELTADEISSAFLIDRYELPMPRTDLAKLVPQFANASMDISDGLVGDLEKLCRASGVGASIDLDMVPLSPAARELLELGQSVTLSRLVTAGDDYELLITVPAARKTEFDAVITQTGADFVPIGEIVGGRNVQFVSENGEVMVDGPHSYSHF